ncbi:helix-turn-helix domain-containing protein [Lactiplantibacillus herbarum]|uniref:helix-turn-helix domain-containing protein n=1 Tax=Lactiplantibacillus herbarum TaxID=1670446 RepID=UPI00064FE99D|nr:helix-turn-helix transcriptional regulator [Lactiplantibacillus herbarum]
MTNMNFDDYLAKRMKNPGFKAAFDSEDSKLASAVTLMKAREKAGLTQRELAVKAAIPQSTVARIERGGNTSIDTMSKIAVALGKRIELKFV